MLLCPIPFKKWGDMSPSPPPPLSDAHEWCSRHFFWEVENNLVQINNAVWTSSLGTAVVIRIVFPRYPLVKKFISFPPASMYAQRS